MKDIARLLRDHAPLLFCGVALVLCSAVGRAQAPWASGAGPSAGCPLAWQPTFGGEPGANSYVRTLLAFDDGSGPALFAGGAFWSVGGVAAERIARWDGATWSALGAGTDGTVQALAAFDDGSGPALYAAGDFTRAGGPLAAHVARWNGTSWSPLGSGTNYVADELAVYDDGSGPALYVGGYFTTAGGAPASQIARWDGSSWSPLSSGLNSYVTDLVVHDDGSGSALYAGGRFTTAGGVAVNYVARWDGASWSDLNGGADDQVNALAVYDDGSGPALYAGGYFLAAGGAPAAQIARWDGSSWSPLGTGVNSIVTTLAVWDDGSGPALYVSGDFTTAGGVPAPGLARWDGTSWSSLGADLDFVYAMVPFDDGAGEKLYFGGTFTSANGVPASRLASWDGATWGSVGGGANALTAAVLSLAVHDEGGGTALYAGGQFGFAGGLPANGIGRWDGTAWSTLGTGMGGPTLNVEALASFDEGSGPALFAGGWFTSAGGTSASRIARWDGVQWSTVGGGMNDTVYALCTYDDGGGPALYAGGSFTIAGGVGVQRIAKWDGTSWSQLSGGVTTAASPHVRALAVFDDGAGPALFVGGRFRFANGISAKRIARWDGASWSALGTGIGDGSGDQVGALAVFDEGSGPALFAGGTFTVAGGVAVGHIARWDGTSWSALEASGGACCSASIDAMTVFDDGNGPALYVGGGFANHIGRWDGTGWSLLGSGSIGSVHAFAEWDSGSGPSLYASTPLAPDSGDSHLARWGGCPSSGPTTFCSGDAIACPCGNGGAPGAGCDNAQGTGGVTLTLAAQSTSANAATLVGTGFPAMATPTALVIRSNALDPARPVVFGDGLRCVAASPLVRLAATTAIGGSATHVVGHGAMAGGGDFHYQIWYRNTPSSFCDPLHGFNLSSGISLTWP